MNALEKNVAVLRGEALASSLLASAALQALFSIVLAEHREKMLAGMTAMIDDTLNRSGPGQGDPNDEPIMQMREVARHQIDQHLSVIKRMIDGAPK